MRQGRLDEMVGFAADALASEDKARINRLVRTMAETWETEPALAICFALTSAGSLLESQFQDQQQIAQRAYVLSSLLAADIFALEQMGQTPAMGYHLLPFWLRVDPYFLDL